jgi:hypothetical protein
LLVRILKFLPRIEKKSEMSMKVRLPMNPDLKKAWEDWKLVCIKNNMKVLGFYSFQKQKARKEEELLLTLATTALTDEQSNLWKWFRATPSDLFTHLNGQEVQLLRSVPRQSKNLTQEHWALLRRVKLQYCAFYDKPCTRQTFKATPVHTAVNSTDAIDVDAIDVDSDDQ